MNTKDNIKMALAIIALLKSIQNGRFETHNEFPMNFFTPAYQSLSAWRSCFYLNTNQSIMSIRIG